MSLPKIIKGKWMPTGCALNRRFRAVVIGGIEFREYHDRGMACYCMELFSAPEKNSGWCKYSYASTAWAINYVESQR